MYLDVHMYCYYDTALPFLQNQYKPLSKKQKPDHGEDDELLVCSPALDDVDKVAIIVGVVHSGT